MESLILAAGLGTRLRPLTDRTPKPLIEVAGVAMLERVARRLVAAGCERIVINVHHHADAIEHFVRDRDGFGVEVRFSREEGDAPLETGGGVQQAANHLSLDAPFLVHNSDVLTDLDLGDLYRAHDAASLATLVVGDHETRSPLLVDDRGMLGVRYPSGEARTAREPAGDVKELAFCGISVVDPELPSLMTETGAFSIIPVYLRLIRDGHRVAVQDLDGAQWIDIGTHERLARAERLLSG